MPLGQALIAAGVITPTQLRLALQYQDSHPDSTLGMALLHLQFATADAIEAAALNNDLMKNPDMHHDPKLVIDLIDSTAVRQHDLAVAFEQSANLVKNTL